VLCVPCCNVQQDVAIRVPMHITEQLLMKNVHIEAIYEHFLADNIELRNHFCALSMMAQILK
jgi:hypothetical protein